MRKDRANHVSLCNNSSVDDGVRNSLPGQKGQFLTLVPETIGLFPLEGANKTLFLYTLILLILSLVLNCLYRVNLKIIYILSKIRCFV